MSSGAAFFLLFASLFGSYVNIPISALGQDTKVTEREVTYFGMRYIVPVMVGSPDVILAVNVGGAARTGVFNSARSFAMTRSREQWDQTAEA